MVYNTSDDMGKVFSNCVFQDNHASRGAALAIYYTDNALVENCYFSDNDSHQNGGGGIYSYNSEFSLINCTVWGNVCDTDENDSGLGGGLYIEGGSSTITNCYFSVKHRTFFSGL